MKPLNITSALHKILGLQTTFRSSVQLPYFRAMSTVPSADYDINRVITYWFEGEDIQKKWFSGGPKVDTEIRDNFAGLIEKARASQLMSWTQEPKSTLALIVLLDQFSRNIHRGSPLSYSADPMAMNISTEAIAKGFDLEVTNLQQPFFYLPLMHDEHLVSQIAARALYDGLITRCEPDSDAEGFAQQSRAFAKRHQDIIQRFGRFPSRNEVLGRVSTPEEIEFLKEYPSGF